MKKDWPCVPANLQNVSPNAMRMARLMRMSRRDMLMTSMGAAVAYGVASGAAGAEETQPSPAPGADPVATQFMAVSRLLTDRPTLDLCIGNAIYAGIVHSSADRQAQISKLHDLMGSGQFTDATAFAAAAEKADPALKDVIHDILTGWYRGVADGKVVVYRSALMFDITKDAIYPKTYAAGGPFYWTTQPPEVDRPTGHPALSPSKFVVEPT
ncbi:sorbitol dehydrogenase family protein [Acetobacter malorum]|nr:sorbitol dehydrogenase family protein [Acetobacter malorum]